MHKLFSYGTLMRGESRHDLLAKAEFLGEALSSPNFDLYSLGEFPAMVAGGTQQIHGELYLVDEELLTTLDAIEGHPHFYRRSEIFLAGGEKAITYLLNMEVLSDLVHHDFPAILIESGSWRNR